MLCAQVQHQINAYVDGALPESVQRQVEDHLGACPDCFAQVARFQKLAGLLAQNSVPEIPDGLSASILRLAHARATSHRQTHFLLWFDLPAPMKAAAVFVLAAGLTMGTLLGWSLTQQTTSAPQSSLAMFDLDKLAPMQNGSLEQAYATLIEPVNSGGK